MPDRPVVVVTRRLPEVVERALLERFDARLNASDEPLDAAQLAEAMRAADGILSTVTDRIDRAVLETEGARARILANFGVGVNHVDLAAARERGIVVTNTPDVLTDDTADLAIALMLMTLRRLGAGERELREGRWTGWRPTHGLGARLRGRTLGIVGLGRIGQAVARRASDGFGMPVLYFDPSTPMSVARAAGASAVGSLDELLERSDVVSLHCPSTPETRHLMDEARLARMRPGSFLINTARGDVVDERALVRALERGHLAGAGLDVHEHEPQVTPELLRMENVVLLPHLGSATLETRVAMGERALENLVAFFEGRGVRDRVV